MNLTNMSFVPARNTTLIAVLLCLLCSALSLSSAGAEPVKIGVLSYRPKPQTLAQWQPLAVVLKQSMPEHDFVIEALSFPEMNAAVAGKKLDFVLTNSGHYVLLSYQYGLSSPLATLTVDDQGRALSKFGGVIFSRADASGIAALADLRGKSVAATSTESLGGYQMQAYELRHAGINLPRDAKLIVTGMPHDNVVNAVLSGRVAAGFVRTGVLEAMVREGHLDMQKIKILNRQNQPKFPLQLSTHLYPEWPFVALPHTEGKLARHVAAALFLLEENRIAAQSMQIHGFAVPVDYTPVADLLRELRMPPFDKAPEFTLRDVWNHYRWQLIVVLLGLGVIAFLAARLQWMNRKLAAEKRIESQQKQQLQENESRFRFMLETSPIAVRIASTASHQVLFANKRYAELIEADSKEVPGVNPRSYYANHQDYESILETLSQGSSVTNRLIELVIPGGKTKWTLASYLNLTYGDESAVLGWFYDISERRQIEIALHDSEATYRALFESSIDALSIIDPETGRFIDCNDAAVRFYDTGTRENLIGTTPDMLSPEYQPNGELSASSAMAHIQRAFGAGRDTFEWTHKKSDDTVFPALVSLCTIVLKGKTYILAIGRDFTERKKMEEALRHSEASLNKAQHIAHVGSWELDLVKNRLWWSNEIYDIFEIDPDQFGASYEAFINAIHPDDREAVNRAYLGSLENKSAYEIDHRLRLPDGRVKYVRERCESEFDAEGKPLRSMGTVQDITGSKLISLALERSEAASHALINANTESAFLLDEAGIVIDVNEIGARRLGKERDDLIGTNFFALMPPEIAQSRKEHVNQVFRSGKSSQLQDERNGIHFNTNLYPVLDPAGNVVNVAVYAEDVTERLQLQGIDQLFYTVNQQLLLGASLDQLFEYICVEVTKIFGYRFAWIGRKDAGGAVLISASAGPAAAYRGELERIGVRWDDTLQGKGPTGLAIRAGQSQVSKLSDPNFQSWKKSATINDLNAVYSAPIIVRGEIYGAITLYSRHDHSFDTPGTVKRLSGIVKSICIAVEMAHNQEQLSLLRSALSATANGVFITDKTGHIQWVNQAFIVLTGYTETEAIGSTPNMLNSGRQNAAYFENLWSTILRGEVWRNEMQDRHKDGSDIYINQTITPIVNALGDITHFIAVLEDISARKIAESRIQYMAHYDALTNLPNRALLLDRLGQVLVAAKRSNETAALMFLDLDGFKSVNDTLGHHAGDLLLQQVALRLKGCVRESDTVARLAGDEFTVVLPEITSSDDAKKVAEKIIDTFTIPFDLDGHELYSAASIGIALFPNDATDEEGLLKQADSAMYTAKQGGKNKFEFFDPK